MNIKTNLFKKRPRKVTFESDEFYVRCLTITEQKQIEDNIKNGASDSDVVRFALTRGIVEQDCTKVFEPDSPDADEIPMETARFLFDEIGKASKVAKIENVEKKSEATP